MQFHIIDDNFDASGHPAAPGIASAYYVCGFVAPVEKWEKFGPAWRALLDAYAIPSPFHMAEFMARRKRFQSWNGDDRARDAFRLEATRLLKRLTNKPFAVGVVIPDLRRMFREYDVATDVPRSPYAWCALRACEHLFEWAFNRVKAGAVSGADKLEIVFEHGDADRGEFANALKIKHRAGVTFLKNPGKQLAPFAASDFLAWEFRNWMARREKALVKLREVERFVTPATRAAAKLKVAAMIKPDPVIEELARQLPADSLTYANWDTLVRVCERKGYGRREV